VKIPIDLDGLLSDFYKHLDKNKKFKKQREMFIEFLLTESFSPSQKIVKKILLLLVDRKEDWEIINERLVFLISKGNPDNENEEEDEETPKEPTGPPPQTGPGYY
jgi:hypothetical protein